jgi:histidyl-tRNA synthetase
MNVMAEQSKLFRAPRGTYDLMPPESKRWRALMDLALDIYAESGYELIETPAFEHTEVFERGVGPTSDVVTKQMYTFTDRGGRSLTLRPEITAPVVRAVLEHNLHRSSLPVKLAYASAQWRQERPQRGRYRQFWQVGIEALGSEDPRVDAEVIEIAERYLGAAGVTSRLLLNSIGHPDPSCRLGYNKILTEWLQDNAARLAPEDRDRIATNPLRTFDSKEPATIETLRAAPLISDHICDECRRHFESVTGLLADLEVVFAHEPRMVRGLDYYTRTTFEFRAEGLGTQDTVLGGGRYDGLAETLGGPSLPGIGFSSGVERVLIAGGEFGETPGETAVRVYVVAVGDDARGRAFKLATDLRRARIGADLDLVGRGLKGQMKDASRSGARWAAILGDAELATGEITLRELDSGEQERIPIEGLAGRVAQ